MPKPTGKGARKKFVPTPSQQIRLRTSKDGKYVMLDVVKTCFFATSYLAKVVENARHSHREASHTKSVTELKAVEG